VRPFIDDGTSSVRVVFAVGALERVTDEVRRLGDRAVLVAGRHASGAADQVVAAAPGTVVARIDDVVQHVPVPLVESAVRHARAARADVLVALGGGSSVGLAKAVARETGLPILAVPTTYAGSEMTPIWGVTDVDGKVTGRDPRVLPRTVVYDPALTTSLPARLSAASGMNAIAHAVEALYAPDTSPVTALLADEGIRALASALPVVVERPGDLEARSGALYGSWLSGRALGVTTMGLHHTLAHVLGGRYRLPHADVHSVLLPRVVEFNTAAAPEAMARVAHALRAGGVGNADDAAPALDDLVRRIGAPASLASLGLAVETIPDIVRTVAAAAVVNPRPVDAASLDALLRTAYAGPAATSSPSPVTPRGAIR
jgi:alcohol dehydrogenase class IV